MKFVKFTLKRSQKNYNKRFFIKIFVFFRKKSTIMAKFGKRLVYKMLYFPY